jgi:hypothetical protein
MNQANRPPRQPGRFRPASSGGLASKAKCTGRAAALAARWHIKELNSLADLNKATPALPAYPFEGPPITFLYPWWSSTPVTGGSGAAWAIDFYSGEARQNVGTPGNVRLVRNVVVQ